MKINSQQQTLLESFKGKQFKNLKLKTGNGQATSKSGTDKTVEEQIKKLTEQRKKKVQELQKIEKMNIPKEEKTRRKKAIENDLKTIDASILQLKSPKKKGVRKTQVNGKG